MSKRRSTRDILAGIEALMQQWVDEHPSPMNRPRMVAELKPSDTTAVDAEQIRSQLAWLVKRIG